MTKFIEKVFTNDWEVETPNGWKSFSGVAKTIEYDEWEIITETGKHLLCADKHILIDENWNEIFCNKLKENYHIQTKNGLEKIASVRKTDNKSNMYDLLDVQDGNIFYSNGIVSHNSTTAISYLMHYIIFNDNANIALLANKAQTAKELLGRLQLAYENLPKWMQHGVKIWNKASLELDNGSKIVASSTSGSTIRGGSYNVIFLDEFAFIPNQIADEFFSSVYPTITSGKNTKVIMISCVSKDTYLLTSTGYKKIETFIDLTKDGAYQVPDYNVMGKNKFYTSDIIVNNKKSLTNNIKTRYETLECSQDHKLWAFDGEKYGFIESKNLKVGDYVSIRYNQQVFGNQDYIGFNPEKGKALNTFSCDYVNEDIAYFIGLYVAEGYSKDIVSKRTGTQIGGQVIITCGDDISSSLDKLNLTYNAPDNIHYVINSKHLTDFIKELGFDITNKSSQKSLPEKVMSWSKNNITALLRGMFDGDGGIDSKGRVKYTSTSRELIRQIQLLLANLGILGSVYKSTVGPSKKVKVCSTHYNIEIIGKYAFEYYNQIGFSLQRKQDRYNLLKPSSRLGSRTDIIPNSALILNEYNAPKFDKRSRSKNTKSYSRELLLEHRDLLCSNEKINQFFEDNVSESLIWLEIKEIEQGETEVFDVSLPDIEGDKWAHSVLYNNFIGHQTPKGMNAFYKFWTDAIRGKNEYVPMEVHWSEVPGRDEKWKQQTIANTSQEQWQQEFECSFLGSVDTLISSAKLQCLIYNDPIKSSEGFAAYEPPKDGHNYMITVDVSEGTGKDYHAFVVIDITNIPYRVVAKYKNNELKPMLLPDIIYKIANSYNKAYVLIEIASVGDQIAKDLMFDLEYENMLMCSMRGRSGQLVGQGFSGKTSQLGIKMSKQVKRVGCSNLKTIIEDDKLIINDFDIISELTTFVSKNHSFEGEVGCNDDLSMCLVIFSWLIVQDYFKEMTNNDVRKRIYEEQKDQIEQDMSPFGFINDGVLNTEEEFEEKETGDYWMVVDNKNKSPYEVWNLDEYGDISNEFNYMWTYQ